MQKIVLVCALVVAIASSAPVQEAETPFEIFSRLCVTMDVEHNGALPMPLPFPVSINIVPDLPTYTRGQSILITLVGNNGFQFMGFLIQARAAGSTIPMGSWASGATGWAVGCRNPQPDFSGNDTAAHLPGSTRSIQELVWTAPEEPGTYRFQLTTVERFGVHWKEQFTPFFNVV